MRYFLDFRKNVVSFIEEGGSRREAGRLFKISRNTLYRWWTSEGLCPKRHGPRYRKLDKAALKGHVQDYPDAKLSERGAHFGVHTRAIGSSLRQKKSA
ncbi:IS630 transposase-related protein [Nitrosococcus watsonii]|uniref:IS630 transposase-related protein n=1 Tax=Nitrosococcus watsonii TaxID=473531 RepID=UPI0002F79A98|nr:IS630 transposase-related protein [Nitrosococcus watsonii]